MDRLHEQRRRQVIVKTLYYLSLEHLRRSATSSN